MKFTIKVAKMMMMMMMEREAIRAPGKHGRTVLARSLLYYWAVREVSLSMTSMARKLNISVGAV